LSETVDILEFDFSSAINGEKFKEFFGLIGYFFALRAIGVYFKIKDMPKARLPVGQASLREKIMDGKHPRTMTVWVLCGR